MSTYTKLLKIASDIDRVSARKKKEETPTSDVKMDDLPDQCVFRSLDKKPSDFADTDFYLVRKKGEKVLVMDKDGARDWYPLEELNIDRKSIRKLRDSDPDYEGMRD